MGQHCYDYPRPSVTVDLVIFATDEAGTVHVLLIKRGKDPYKDCWALPGGFLDENETLKQAAARELKEETGLEIEPEALFNFGIYDAVDRDSRGRVISMPFSTNFIPLRDVKGADDAVDAQWFKLTEAVNLPLAFDHKQMLLDAVPFLGYFADENQTNDNHKE